MKEWKYMKGIRQLMATACLIGGLALSEGSAYNAQPAIVRFLPAVSTTEKIRCLNQWTGNGIRLVMEIPMINGAVIVLPVTLQPAKRSLHMHMANAETDRAAAPSLEKRYYAESRSNKSPRLRKPSVAPIGRYYDTDG